MTIKGNISGLSLACFSNTMFITSSKDLYTWKYVDGTPMANHIVSMLDIKQQIIDAGET
jgi:hypothetical protein